MACGLGVGVDGVDEAADDVAHRAAGDGVELGALLGGELELELGEPGGEGGGLVLGEGQGGGLVEQLLEARRDFSRLSGGSTKSCSVTPTASTMHEPGLRRGVGGDGLEVGRGDGAGAAALHLLEVLRRSGRRA